MQPRNINGSPGWFWRAKLWMAGPQNGLFCQTLIKKYDKCPSTARTRTKDIFDYFLPRMNPNLTVFVAGSYQYRLLFGSVWGTVVLLENLFDFQIFILDWALCKAHCYSAGGRHASSSRLCGPGLEEGQTKTKFQTFNDHWVWFLMNKRNCV